MSNDAITQTMKHKFIYCISIRTRHTVCQFISCDQSDRQDVRVERVRKREEGGEVVHAQGFISGKTDLQAPHTACSFNVSVSD